MTSFFDYHEQVRRKPPGAAGSSAATSASATPAVQPGDKGAVAALTVSELTAQIDRAVRAGVPQTVTVHGEISNFRPHQASGHWYFTLKDANSCIDCVMWKSDADRLKFKPSGGIEMLAVGNVRVFGKAGKYQLYVTSLRPLGQGALELAFQQLRAKLQAERLFEPENKKPLPRYPLTIVLMTGADTAALQDMLKVLRTFPWLRLLVYPVPVQGEGAGAKIAAALGHMSRCGEDIGADLIILGRGGGSMEDLWAFNEEAVARAIAACRLPVITGIGHEVDTSIADLVADYHAHTPTEAARIATGLWKSAPTDLTAAALGLGRSMRNRLLSAGQRLRAIERHEAFRRPTDRINSLRQVLDDRQRAMTTAVTHQLHQSQWRLADLRGRLDRFMPAAVNRLRGRVELAWRSMSSGVLARLRRCRDRVAEDSARLLDFHPKHRLPLQRQRLAALADRLERSSRAKFLLQRQKLDATDRQLQAIGPENVLRRGYSITRLKKGGALLKSVAQVKPGDRLLTRLADGEIESTAEDPRQPGLFD